MRSDSGWYGPNRRWRVVGLKGDCVKNTGMDKSMQVFGGIWMGKNDDSKISDVRISLLEKIGEYGSITQAA